MNDMRIELYLPTMPHRAAEKAKAEILSGCGGITITQGLGSWVDDDGATITEAVEVVTAFVPDNEDNRLWVEAVARQYKADAEQQCVLFVLNGNETNFIED